MVNLVKPCRSRKGAERVAAIGRGALPPPEQAARAEPAPGRRRLRTARRAASGTACLLGALALAGCSQNRISFLDPQGPVAAAQRTHFFWVIGLTLIVVLPVIVLTPLIAWRYRYRSRKTTYAPKWEFSWPLEFLVWGVPLAIVIALGWHLWGSTQALDPYKPLDGARPVRVQVVGYDWKWLFIYPDQGVASVGTLVFPAGRPLELRLTSATVMQSFYIPALGSQIYAMSGMVTRLNLKANAPGRFMGENTQYNGAGFHTQSFVARAVAPGRFSDWVGKVRRTGVTLDARSYAALAQRGTAADLARALGLGSAAPAQGIGFRDVPPALFDNIVRRGPRSSAADILAKARNASATAPAPAHPPASTAGGGEG